MMMLSLWLPDFILITTHTNINILSIGPNIGPKMLKFWLWTSHSFLLFLFHSLSLFCSDAFFLNCRPRHDPLSSKRQDRERRGKLGIPPTPIPSPTSTPAPPALGERSWYKRRRRRGCGTQLFILLFSRLKVYIYTYVHMMRKWFHLNIWRPYLHLPHLNICFWSKF